MHVQISRSWPNELQLITAYMQFGFGGKKKNANLFTTSIKDREELSEINKIAEMLNPDEKVLLVAKQSRIKPGGYYITPNIVYATDRRIIVRDPYVLGLKYCGHPI